MQRAIEIVDLCASLEFTLYYNFARIHQKHRVALAMAAGVTERVWEVTEIVTLLNGIPIEENYSDVPYCAALGPNRKASASNQSYSLDRSPMLGSK